MLLCFIEISVFNANSVEPDQTPRSVASDLGLHCFADNSVGVEWWVPRLKWVNLVW